MDKEERKAYYRAYRESHKEQISASQKKYKQSHKEEQRIYTKEYYQTHKSEHKKATADWKTRNPNAPSVIKGAEYVARREEYLNERRHQELEELQAII